ncbi:MAG: hypothetical protein CMP59_12910 [Flavobacteriales bacterium]|nr:hypothetical protein [Flavobacteriales bacterium]
MADGRVRHSTAKNQSVNNVSRQSKVRDLVSGVWTPEFLISDLRFLISVPERSRGMVPERSRRIDFRFDYYYIEALLVFSRGAFFWSMEFGVRLLV